MQNTALDNKTPINLGNRRYLNAKQLAEYLGKSPDYIARAVKKRLIPFIKPPGGARIFEREKVDVALSRFEHTEIGR